MKILIAGSNKHWALEKVYARNLRTFGAAAAIHPIADGLHDYLSSSILNKIIYRLGYQEVLKKLNAALIESIAQSKPDIVWVFKGIEILPATLQQIRKMGIVLVNYNPDHPFIRTFRSSGGANVEACVPLYDAHFCYSQDLCRVITAKFGIKTDWLPFGFDETFDSSVLQYETSVPRLSFVGNPDKYRKNMVEQLVKAGVPVDLYGHGWNKYFRTGADLKVMDAVYGTEFWKTLNQYRVQLNVFRPHNIGSHNMRTFEVPAAGGIMLAPDSPEHRMLFENEKEVFLYGSNAACVEMTVSLLKESEATIGQIRKQARRRSLESHYSYLDKAKGVFEFFKTL